ncbi:MAG: HNH endonuclease [Patescibacteria group bacterium]
MSENYKRNPNAKCLVCGKFIYRRPSQIERNNKRVFCSTVCYGIGCRKEIFCAVCKNPILARLNKKTCSRSCANRHRVGIQYKINRPRDKVKSQRSIKIRLLDQRGKSCERCGYSRIEILQVHHKNRNRENNELENLELICPNCHVEKHYLENSWISSG